MSSPKSCAKPCPTRSVRDIFVAGALVFAVACGGAVSPSIGSTSGDGGTTTDGSSTADVTTPADCATATAGASCAHEGESCNSGNCNDPCSFCNILQCVGGTWSNLEVPPEPCDDASTRRHADARLTWQGPGGVVGAGPALVVDGSGAVHVWQNQPSFDPSSAPTAPPDATFQVSGANVDALFDTWASTDTSALPHVGGGGECEAAVYVSMCPHCLATTLRYSAASQVAPEMNAVWSWFDANLQSSLSAAHTRSYCNF
jgi:hypothetical protein